MRPVSEAIMEGPAGWPPNARMIARRVRRGRAAMTIDSSDEIGLVLNLSETHAARRRAGGRTTTAAPRIGALTLTPPGCPTTFMLDGTSSGLVMQLPFRHAAQWHAEEHGIDVSRLEVQPRLTVADPILARFLYAACDRDDEEIMRAVVERLFTAHAGRPEDRAPSLLRGGLSPHQIRRVKDRVEAELREPLPLATLARDAGLSPFHFAREFRRTTGVSPHAFVVRRRIDYAIALLARRDMSIVAVARGVGFFDDSHLARHMRRVTGLSPERFRTRVLPDCSTNVPVDG